MVDTLIRDQLRKPLLKQRRELSNQARVTAGAQLLTNLQHYLGDQIPANTAGYLSVGGEIDLAGCLKWLRQQGSNTWLPIIREQFQGLLRFAPFTELTRFEIGQHFNIPEPVFTDSQLCTANDLELVLVPLVAFDLNGHRLGMGGGYYDKTFSFRLGAQSVTPLSTQRFVGVAHEFQSLDTIPNESWDVPLDAIITDQDIHLIKQH